MEALDLPPLWPTSTSGPILLQSEPPLPNLVQNLPELANSLHKNDKANFGQPGSANILSSTNTFVNLFSEIFSLKAFRVHYALMDLIFATW